MNDDSYEEFLNLEIMLNMHRLRRMKLARELRELEEMIVALEAKIARLKEEPS